MHRNQGKHSMPLSLLSTHVLANWYIAKLDEYITESYPNISYYGRYVDDCMIVMQSKPDTRNAIEHINELLPGFIKRHEDTFVFNIPKTTTINGIDRLSIFAYKQKNYTYITSIVNCHKKVWKSTKKSKENVQVNSVF